MSRSTMWRSGGFLILVVLLPGCQRQAKEPSLADCLKVIQTKQFVDLTHAFEPGIPHWPGFPDEQRETIYWYEGSGSTGKGFFAQRYSLVGQWGTHCDPPAHFAKGKRTIDEIDPKEMILPLAVIDVHEKAVKNPDYTIRMEDVRGWEGRHGPIPQRAFVAMRTDWSKRWPDAKAMRNEDENGVAHYQIELGGRKSQMQSRLGKMSLGNCCRKKHRWGVPMGESLANFSLGTESQRWPIILPWKSVIG